MKALFITWMVIIVYQVYTVLKTVNIRDSSGLLLGYGLYNCLNNNLSAVITHK